jgi:hypothetical protein
MYLKNQEVLSHSSRHDSSCCGRHGSCFMATTLANVPTKQVTCHTC